LDRLDGPGREQVALALAAGRIAAQDVMAEIDIQPFDNAAMDGFAVNLADIKDASSVKPVRLTKAGMIAAGETLAGQSLTAGTCWHIMTGAKVPAGADCIVPIEEVLMEGDTVIFKSIPKLGQHIRKRGEDFLKGTKITLTGERISAAHIMPLATLGISSLDVLKKPRVLFISTGAEIIDDLSSPLQEGQIYNSNAAFALSFLKGCGVDVIQGKTIRDEPDVFLSTIRAAQEEGYSLIISSGAVSAGAYDFVKESLKVLGAEILYHKIKLKPGKPNLFAKLPGGALYFGLPGNPVATSVGLRFFVAEALRVMQAQSRETPLYARAMNRFTKKPGLHMILKARYESWEDGTLSVDILDGQESFMVSPFLKMNCWAHTGEEVDTIKAGDVVEIYPLMPD
jgi:molybdopterin molybdotransferase